MRLKSLALSSILCLVATPALMTACGKDQSAVAQASTPAQRALLGTWLRQTPDGGTYAWYFAEDGFFHGMHGGAHFGGRWFLDGNRLYLRYNQRVGYMPYLSEPKWFEISVRAGESFTLPLDINGTVSPTELTFWAAHSPYGDPPTPALRSLEGRYVVTSPSGDQEMWEFNDRAGPTLRGARAMKPCSFALRGACSSLMA